MKEPIGENQEIEIKEAKTETQNELQEVLDTDLDLKMVEEIKRESEESLEELDQENTDKKHGWGEPVEGEVEIDGEKVKVRYREKVITLPERRRAETGITHIRRRELLPPLPKGLYVSAEERKNETFKKEYVRIQNNDYKNLFEQREYLPTYSIDKKFKNFYGFLTDGIYPNINSFNHVFNLMGDYYPAEPYGNQQRHNIDSFIAENLYFQKIRSSEENRHFKIGGGEGSGLWFSNNNDGPWHKFFTTPIFFFNFKTNRKFIKYAEDIRDRIFGKNREYVNYDKHKYRYRNFVDQLGGVPLPIINDVSQNPLRWCNADCALIPTKRGLNVLFFETGDEPENETENK